MAESAETTSDLRILDLLRKSGPLSVLRLAALTRVTHTAVRQRLTRLMKQELIERVAEKYGRGRPVHRYSLTDKGRRQAGNNFGDLAVALWQEIREIPDAEVRRGLLKRLSARLAGVYRGSVDGATLEERMQNVADLLGERNMPFSVDSSGSLPVLTAHACPYPDLAEADRGICSLEKMMLTELLQESVHLSECRLDGGTCCRFETRSTPTNQPVEAVH